MNLAVFLIGWHSDGSPWYNRSLRWTKMEKGSLYEIKRPCNTEKMRWSIEQEAAGRAPATKTPMSKFTCNQYCDKCTQEYELSHPQLLETDNDLSPIFKLGHGVSYKASSPRIVVHIIIHSCKSIHSFFFFLLLQIYNIVLLDNFLEKLRGSYMHSYSRSLLDIVQHVWIESSCMSVVPAGHPPWFL